MLDGIQKRLARVLQPDTVRARLRDLVQAGQTTRPDPGAIRTRLTETRRRIARLVDTLASGSGDLPSVREALATLERERNRLEAELATPQVSAPSGEDLDRLVDSMLAGLDRLRDGVPNLRDRTSMRPSFPFQTAGCREPIRDPSHDVGPRASARIYRASRYFWRSR